MAFNWETQGSSLAVLPLGQTGETLIETKNIVLFEDASGRQDRSAVRKIQGHADIVTDFAFSPFDDGLIATGSQDQTIKLWRLPAPGSLTSDLTEAELELPEQPRRVETVSWHPLADGLLVRSPGQGPTEADYLHFRQPRVATASACGTACQGAR